MKIPNKIWNRINELLPDDHGQDTIDKWTIIFQGFPEGSLGVMSDERIALECIVEFRKKLDLTNKLVKWGWTGESGDVESVFYAIYHKR